MIKLNLLELFAGTKSISNIAEKLGYTVFNSDFDEQFETDYTIDIMNFDIKEVPFKPDIIWASPPCQAFSVATIGKNWTKLGNDLIAKSDRAEQAIKIVERTWQIIDELNPTYFYIENPVGALRKIGTYRILPKKTVTYCQYGDTRMKPTDIWTNNHRWKPRKMCKNGMDCHESAPRGSKTGTQGLKNSIERAKVPDALCYEILLLTETLELF